MNMGGLTEIINLEELQFINYRNEDSDYIGSRIKIQIGPDKNNPKHFQVGTIIDPNGRELPDNHVEVEWDK